MKHAKTTPHPVDVHIGKRLRLARTLAGQSQDELSRQVGVTYQQIQKYEKSIDRVYGGRLYDLAIALGVTPQFFYDGYGDSNAPKPSRKNLHLIRNFNAIPSLELRNAFAALVAEIVPENTDGA